MGRNLADKHGAFVGLHHEGASVRGLACEVPGDGLFSRFNRDAFAAIEGAAFAAEAEVNIAVGSAVLVYNNRLNLLDRRVFDRLNPVAEDPAVLTVSDFHLWRELLDDFGLCRISEAKAACETGPTKQEYEKSLLERFCWVG